MRTILVVISCSLVVLTACISAALIQARQQTDASKRALADLSAQVDELSAQLSALAAEKSILEEEVQTQAAAAIDLKTQLEQERLEVAPAVAPIQPPKPFRVQTYLGRDSLGEAWLVPRNFAQDPETGRVSYQPVIVLDEKLKSKFTVVVQQTNYVEQPVPTTVNYNYTPPRSYYYPVYYSVGGRHRPDRPPDRPPPPSGPVPPPIFRPPGTQGGGPWSSIFVPPR